MEDPAIQAILDEGRKTRKYPSRPLWVVSLLLAGICVLAIAIGLYRSWNVKPLPRKTPQIGNPH